MTYASFRGGYRISEGGQNYKGAPHKYGECSQKLYSFLNTNPCIMQDFQHILKQI